MQVPPTSRLLPRSGCAPGRRTARSAAEHDGCPGGARDGQGGRWRCHRGGAGRRWPARSGCAVARCGWSAVPRAVARCWAWRSGADRVGASAPRRPEAVLTEGPPRPPQALAAWRFGCAPVRGPILARTPARSRSQEVRMAQRTSGAGTTRSRGDVRASRRVATTSAATEEDASEEGRDEEDRHEEGAGEEGCRQEGGREEAGGEEGRGEEGAGEEGRRRRRPPAQEGTGEEGAGEEGAREEGGGQEGRRSRRPPAKKAPAKKAPVKKAAGEEGAGQEGRRRRRPRRRRPQSRRRSPSPPSAAAPSRRLR